MFKYAKKTIGKLTNAAAEKSTYVWQFQTLKQLRFKFEALRVGIRKNKEGVSVLFNLRRNVHRLEKGLCYPTGKAVFAEDYIVETIGYLEAGLRKGELDDSTKDWAFSVLSLYFRTVVASPVISVMKTKFGELFDAEHSKSHVPYLNSERPALSVSYDDLLQLSIRRRSVRYFSEKTVESGTVQRCFEIARYSPSACNRQAFQFLFFNKKEIVDRLSKIPGGVAGYSLPALIVVTGRYDGYFDVRDINAPVIDSSLSIMSFLYGAETLGLGTVCINWPNLVDREKRIRDVIDIEPSEFVVMMIGIGYPLDSGKIPFSGKRPNSSALLINQRIKNKEI